MIKSVPTPDLRGAALQCGTRHAGPASPHATERGGRRLRRAGPSQGQFKVSKITQGNRVFFCAAWHRKRETEGEKDGVCAYMRQKTREDRVRDSGSGRERERTGVKRRPRPRQRAGRWEPAPLRPGWGGSHHRTPAYEGADGRSAPGARSHGRGAVTCAATALIGARRAEAGSGTSPGKCRRAPRDGGT